MANIFLRRHYYLYITTGAHLSAKIQLTVDGTLRGKLNKKATTKKTNYKQ